MVKERSGNGSYIYNRTSIQMHEKMDSHPSSFNNTLEVKNKNLYQTWEYQNIRFVNLVNFILHSFSQQSTDSLLLLYSLSSYKIYVLPTSMQFCHVQI